MQAHYCLWFKLSYGVYIRISSSTRLRGNSWNLGGGCDRLPQMRFMARRNVFNGDFGSFELACKYQHLFGIILWILSFDPKIVWVRIKCALTAAMVSPRRTESFYAKSRMHFLVGKSFLMWFRCPNHETDRNVLISANRKRHADFKYSRNRNKMHPIEKCHAAVVV